MLIILMYFDSSNYKCLRQISPFLEIKILFIYRAHTCLSLNNFSSLLGHNDMLTSSFHRAEPFKHLFANGIILGAIQSKLKLNGSCI